MSRPGSAYEREAYEREMAIRTGSFPRVHDQQVTESPFYNARLEAIRTVKPRPYEPTGSFSHLRGHGESMAARDTMQEKKHYMPGYTGFIRGSQHLSGRTYGEMTRRAYDTEYAEQVSKSPIPSDPHRNRRIQQLETNSLVNNENFIKKTYHVPGYTGHVPGVRYTYAQSYGNSTSQEVQNWNATHNRPISQEQQDFAATSKPRMLIPLDSCPLPGAVYKQDPPEKMIPDHLKYLKFFAL